MVSCPICIIHPSHASACLNFFLDILYNKITLLVKLNIIYIFFHNSNGHEKNIAGLVSAKTAIMSAIALIELST